MGQRKASNGQTERPTSANNHVGVGALSILEMQRDALRTFVDTLESLVEMSTLRRHGFDELVEEMSSVYALQASRLLLVEDDSAFLLSRSLGGVKS